MSGNPVIRWPVVSGGQPAGQPWLNAALTATGRRDLLQLGLRWPTVEVIARRLAAYLTDAIPMAGAPSLLAAALARGLRDSRTGDDRARLQGFVRGLLEPLPEVLAWRVWLTTGRRAVWDPLGPLALAQFRRAGPVRVDPLPPAARLHLPPDSLRLTVAARLLDSIDLGCLGGDIRVVCTAAGGSGGH